MAAHGATLAVAVGLLSCKWVGSAVDGDDAGSTAVTRDDVSNKESKQASPDEPVRPKPGYVEVTVGGVGATENGNVVFLLDPQKNQAVPIFIGQAEAFSIQLRLDKRRFQRPLTHDLFDAAVDRLGGKVRSARIDQIKSNTFHATLVITSGNERHELDARSSDAIAIALGNGAPIYMAKDVIRQSGIDVARLEALAEKHEPPDLPAPPDEDPIKL